MVHIACLAEVKVGLHVDRISRMNEWSSLSNDLWKSNTPYVLQAYHMFTYKQVQIKKNKVGYEVKAKFSQI